MRVIVDTKDKMNGEGMDEVDADIVEGLKQEMGLSVIERPDTGIALPRITGFGVVERCEDNGTPLKTELDTKTGNMNLVIDKRAFVQQVFNGLTIAGGEHKGKLLSQELIAEEIKRGKELLLKEDLFEGETGEEYRAYQLTVSKMFSAADNKRKELKDPVNKINKAFQGLLSDTLGELIEIRSAVMTRTKNFKIEAEKREREAAAKDNLWRENTADEILNIASLPGRVTSYDASQIKAVAEELLIERFTPHPDQADRYADAHDQTTQALATMYGDKLKAEEAAALEAKESAKKYAAEQAELEELRAGKVEQGLKDAAAAHLAKVSELFSKCVEADSAVISEAINSADRVAVAFGDNKYIDIPAITGIINKMHSLLEGAYEKEEAAAAAVKEEADRVAKEAAEKKEQADREKAEAAAALEKANQELLHDAGFTFDGKAYTKGGFLINADKAKCSPSSDVGAFIVATDKKIAANEAAAEKAEEGRLAAEKAAAEKAAAEKEADRKSYSLKVEEMTAAISGCEDHEAVVKAILADEIPHVRFVAE